MPTWTPDEQLTFDIAFALKKVTIPGFRKALSEEDRFSIAKTVLEHLKLCRWEFQNLRSRFNEKGHPGQSVLKYE
jgi:hypothetical protein